ncbi:amidohydrolase family protein [Verticiella sediminum]|uniref:Amidohydrolase family protein n=1 Tax=Verticiella sediminum TaxID=1247510 RepID=A0A556AGU0_9BURK|nr:amidohydrolase family protein [Verticiella sediminum]TSH92116.1 amidohydrolase family protein [Verticiella sediminum]
MEHPATPERLRRARLPRWLLGSDWPVMDAQPVLADIALAQGRIAAITPACGHTHAAGDWDLAGAPVLPGLIEAHAHLDKTLTLHRLGQVEPGLLGAIEAMMHDRARWSADDVRERAEQALQWAWAAGVTRMRTHCDWWEPAAVPIAWHVLAELGHDWRARVELERSALIPLTLFAEREDARRLARQVARLGAGAHLGGFVHTSNWNPQALRHLVTAAAEAGLGLDLHIDEELAPQAAGLATLAALLADTGFDGPVVCSHACALSVQDPDRALATLDAVARTPITLVSLPATNLLLQDAQTGRTPRTRGLTLIKEARERGIPVLIGSDNVQDPFCPIGDYDPVQALATGVLAGQLESPFDAWSDAICRNDWLNRGTPRPGSIGGPADFVIFPQARAQGFPGRTHARIVLRNGRAIAPDTVPAGYIPLS